MRLVSLFSAWLLICVASAAPANSLERVEARYTKAKTLQANFKQTVRSGVTRTEKVSEGRLELSYPGRVRWEVERPDPELLVSNGKTLWHYTPPFDPSDSSDKGQAIRRDARKLGSEWLETLLAGRFSKLKGVRVKPLGAQVYELTPSRASREDLVRAEVRLAPGLDLIESVVLEFKSGNRTEVLLSRVSVGGAISPERFEFRPPPGTEIISSL